MMNRSLEEIVREEIWERLESAAAGESSDWKTGWVTSSRDGEIPALRMMVLRAVDSAKRELVFFTDTRTPKWQQFSQNGSETEVGFWSPERKTQLRCCGRASLFQADELTAHYRKQISIHSKPDYTAVRSPGAKIDAPAEGHTTGEDWHFGVVIVTIESLDWLQLSRQGHLRAGFRWQGESCEMSWLQP